MMCVHTRAHTQDGGSTKTHWIYSVSKGSWMMGDQTDRPRISAATQRASWQKLSSLFFTYLSKAVDCPGCRTGVDGRRL